MSASRPFLVGVALVALVAACSSNSTSSGAGACNVSYDCAGGQTCWSDDAKSFHCAASGPGKPGDACNKFSKPGDSPFCGDQLACAAFGTPGGNCTFYCSADGSCPNGTTCRSVTNTSGATIRLCGSSNPSGSNGCNVSYDCPAGQTCWSDDAVTFYCAPSGPGKLGDACDKYSKPGAVPFCGDQLACAAFGTPGGNCTFICSADGSCPSGTTCHTVTNTSGGTTKLRI